jgi:outer membrane protein assembly factor BamB
LKPQINFINPILTAQLFIAIIFIAVINNSCSKKPDADIIIRPPSTSTIITLQASSITYTRAASGGQITQQGTDSLLEKGICYSIADAPTIADSLVISNSISDTFNCALNGLSPNTAFYIRAFVKTAKGTFYGNQVTFKTAGSITSGETATRIYLSGGYTNDLFALDAATGNILWNKKVSAPYVSSAIYSNGRIIVKDNTNNLTAFDTSGNVVWTRKLDGNNNDLALIPVIAQNGIVYCKDLQYTYAFYANDGSLKWRSDNPNTYTRGDGTLTLKDNTIYAQTEYGGLFALEVETGILKWQLDGYGGAPVIFKDAIYLFDIGSSTFIFSIDRNAGNLNWISNALPVQGGGLVNAKYGRIYNVDGWVIDSASVSATASKFLPSMQFFYNSANYPGSYPEGSVYPILADNLAISPAGVCDALTGDLICPIPGYRGGYHGFSGGTYLNHVFYYTTGQYEIYDPYTGGHWYSDVYAYDVIEKKLLWDRQIENADLFNVEPCVIGNAGNVYRGAITSR